MILDGKCKYKKPKEVKTIIFETAPFSLKKNSIPESIELQITSLYPNYFKKCIFVQESDGYE